MSAPQDSSSPSAEDITAAMADLATTFATHTDLAPILAAVTDQAVALIEEVDFADVLVIDGDGHRSLAATNPIAVELDSVQIGLREGPCWQAATHDALVHSADLTREQRWPYYAAAAVATGIESMMCFHLYTHSTTGGETGGRAALNLFSLTRGPFSLADQALGAMLATHAATALIAANRQTQFDSALASRDLIGQAKGILMHRFTIDALRAFHLMTKLSQDTNTPVRLIAQRIVDTP